MLFVAIREHKRKMKRHRRKEIGRLQQAYENRRREAGLPELTAAERRTVRATAAESYDKITAEVDRDLRQWALNFGLRVAVIGGIAAYVLYTILT